MSLWICPKHGLYGGQVFCPICGERGEHVSEDNGRPGGLSSQATEPVPVSALRASIPDAMLDEHGRCCGRKPISYKRNGRWFCDRCCRAYAMATGRQIPNWAWNACTTGFYPTYPDQEPYRTMLANAKRPEGQP